MSKSRIFYGTSAAEGIPSPFCDCFMCRNAREKGGKDVRRRSMFRLDDATCIDLGPDSFSQAILYGDFIHLEHVCITHTHEDHFAYMMMGVRGMAKERISKPLNLYLTDKAYEIIDFYRNNSPILKGSIRDLEKKGVVAFHQLHFNNEYIIGDNQVIPLKGNHRGNMGENSANYVIRMKDGKYLYYGLDTGYYLDEAFDALKNYKLDYLISECTFGNRTDRPARPDGHLDVNSCISVFHRLFQQGTISSNTKIYITHINHQQTGTHEILSELFSKVDLPCKIEVAYDGMSIEGCIN